MAEEDEEEDDPDLQILEHFKECFKAVSGEALVVDRDQLKDIFETMGIPISSDEEFNYQFAQMDEDGDGKVHFSDLEEFLTTPDEDATGGQMRGASSFVKRANDGDGPA